MYSVRITPFIYTMWDTIFVPIPPHTLGIDTSKALGMPCSNAYTHMYTYTLTTQ